MRHVPFLAILILAVSIFGWCIEAGAKDEPVKVDNPVAAFAAGPGTVGGHDLQLRLNLGLSEMASYDYAKCIESCDNQYSACAKNGNAERIKYCSDQHDQCRKACLEHK